MKAYIYAIKNKKNNKYYVGQKSQKKGKREWKHFDDLKKNKHHSYKLQNDYNLYGKDSFTIIILEEIDDYLIISNRENYWINKLNSIENGYNMMKGGGGILTPSNKIKLSESHKDIISKRRKLSDNEAMEIYSMIYFYGKIIRPLSKITNYGRDVIKSVLKDYNNVRNIFDKFDISIKYSIFEKANDKYNFNVKDCTYLPDNIFYLIHYYIKDEVYTKKELSVKFNITNKSINNILNGKVKPLIHKECIDGNIESEKLSILYYLNKILKGNPVPSLERNF